MEDTMEETAVDDLKIEDASVPETTAANPDGGAAKLDADPVSDDLDASIDNLLDEAERETETPEKLEQAETSNPDPDPANAGEVPDQNSVTPDVAIDPTAVQPTESAQIDPEIAAIEQPRNLSEKNQSNWRKLQETATVYKQKAVELEAKVTELSNYQAQVQTPEDYQQLKEFRAVFEVKNDSDFKEQFDIPLAQAHDNIYKIMRDHGASDEVIASMKEKGGPEKIDQQWWKENAIDRLPFTQAEALKKSLIDCYDISKRRAEEIDFVEKHAREIVDMKEAFDREYAKVAEETAYDFVDQITLANKAEWARYKDIPQNATQNQIEQITRHNSEVDGYRDKYFAAYNAKSPDERAAVSAAAVLSHKLVSELEREQSVRTALQDQVRKLSEENSRLKGASKMPRQSVSTMSQNKSNSLNDRIKMSAADAIDLGLDEAGE